MKVQVDKLEIKQIASSIGNYIMEEAKICKHDSMDWLVKAISFYRMLVDMEDFLDLDDKYIIIEIPEDTMSIIAELISNHIFQDISNNDIAIDWLSAMVHLYSECTRERVQLTEFYRKSMSDDNVSANGQEIRMNNMEGEEYEQEM